MTHNGCCAINQTKREIIAMVLLQNEYFLEVFILTYGYKNNIWLK